MCARDKCVRSIFDRVYLRWLDRTFISNFSPAFRTIVELYVKKQRIDRFFVFVFINKPKVDFFGFTLSGDNAKIPYTSLAQLCLFFSFTVAHVRIL